MRRILPVAGLVLMLTAGLLVRYETAAAQTATCDDDTICGAGDTDGEVIVTGSGDESDGGDGEGGVNCVLYAEHPSCVTPVSNPGGGTGLPACVLGADGTFTNEPCNAPPALCIDFDDAGLCVPEPPVIAPPSIDVAGQEAVAQVTWPVVDASPPYTGQLERYAAGYQYSLHLADYDDWSVPLTATATITQTVVQDGIVYSEDFSATITATPREVRWDMGEINDDGRDRPPSKHSPPKTLVCDNPGVGGYFGDGRFQDWQTYDSYGANGVCEYVFWGTTVEMGELAYFSADVVWDLVLETHWDGAIADVGEHVETYVSQNGHEVDVYWVVSVIGDS